MSSAIEAALEALETSRRLLEGKLAEEEAWRALSQLEQREASGEALEILPSAQLRSPLIDDLGRSQIWRAKAAVEQAVDLIKGQQAILGETREAHARALRDAAPALAQQSAADAAPVPVAPERAAEPPPAVAAPLAVQDLTRIRRIDRALAARLNALGVTRYQQIADWRREDIERVSSALALGRIVARQGWIEQAAMLAAREAGAASAAATGESRRVAPGISQRLPPAAAPVGSAAGGPAPVTDPRPRSQPIDATLAVGAADRAAKVAAAAMAAAALPAASPAMQDAKADAQPAATAATSPADEPAGSASAQLRFDALARIRGIDEELARRLSDLGVASFAHVAAWRADELRSTAAALGLSPRRIAKDGWIEQAAMLGKGAVTRHAARIAGGELACLVPPPRQETAIATRIARTDRQRTRPTERLGTRPLRAIAADAEGEARPAALPDAGAAVGSATALAPAGMATAPQPQADLSAPSARTEQPAALVAELEAVDVAEATVELVEAPPFTGPAQPAEPNQPAVHSILPPQPDRVAAPRAPLNASAPTARAEPFWMRPAKSPEARPVPGAVVLGPAMPNRGRPSLAPAISLDGELEATVTVVRRERREPLFEDLVLAEPGARSFPRASPQGWGVVEEATIEVVRRAETEEGELDRPHRPQEPATRDGSPADPEARSSDRRSDPRPEAWWRTEPESTARPAVRRFLDALKGRE